MTDVFKGSTSHTFYFELVDSTTGLPKAGILYTDVTGSYVRSRAARTAITPATLASASAAFSSGGFILVDDTNQPGVYRFDVPDAAFATGVDEVIVTVKATGCRTQSRRFSLVDINNQVAYVPNAAANANGGLPILSSSGTTLGYTVTTITNYTGNTPQTGDTFALANGAAGFVAIDTVVDAILVDTGTDIPASIAGIGTAGGAAINADATTDNASGGISGVTSGTTKVGTETGTFSNTANVNGVYHQITHATNAIDWVYQFLTGGGTSVVESRWVGYLDGSNDTITFYAWNHVGSAWESLGTQSGQAGTVNVTKNLTLYSRHRGTSAAELGKVYIRVACTGMTSPTLYTDQLFVSYAVTSRSVGYALGAVWVDTTGGIAGTESFVNGVADNPVLTLADALTIATANLLRKFEIANGSTITLAATAANKVFEGHEWTLELGGQNIESSMFIDANVSGTGTGSAAEFETCEIGTATLGPSFFHGCGFSGTMTLGAAGNYFFYDCHSSVAGTSTPVFDLAAAGANNMSFRRWSGGITINNISSNDVISIDVVSGGTITLNGADGNVQVRGMCSSIVDNRTGTPTLGKNAVINQTLIATPTNITAGTITTATNVTTVNGLAAGVITDASIADNAITTGTFAAGTTIPRCTLVDTTTTNTDMRGTDSAALAATALSTVQWTNTLATNLGTTNTTVASIGATGTGLSAIPWNAAWDAEVQSEVNDGLVAFGASTVTTAQVNTEVDTALADIHLDHLLATTYDPASKPGAADALLNEIIGSDAGVSQFTANALELAPTGGSVPTAVQIRQEMDSNSTQLAAILVDTNELQTDWVNGGRLDLILDARASQTSVDDVPTNAELATALGTADDATLAAIAALNNLSAAQVTTAATAATPVVTISGTLTTLDAIWNKIKAWLGALAGKTADAVTRAEINATTAGASYNETTDSQEALRDNYTTGGDTLIVAPIVATVPATVVRNSGTTQAFRYTPLPSGPLVIVDSAGAAIDLSTSDLKMICRNVTDPTDTFDLTLTDAELSVSGASHNYINVAYTPTVYGKYQRTTFRKPSGGVWAVIEIGHWQIEDGPNPA